MYLAVMAREQHRMMMQTFTRNTCILNSKKMKITKLNSVNIMVLQKKDN
jgi:hypothetical protein